MFPTRRQFNWMALASLALGLPRNAPAAPAHAVDPRFELLYVLFRMMGAGEYTQGRVPRYCDAVDAWFRAHTDHPVLATLEDMRARHGVSYDAVGKLAVHLGPPPALTPRVPLRPRPPGLDERWPLGQLDRLLRQLRDFVVVADFMGFLETQTELYQRTTAALDTLLARVDLAWFQGFFGERPGATYILVPGLLNGGHSYGADFDEGHEIYSILGVSQVDAQGWPTFEDGDVATIAHEYSHSFVNPLVTAHVRELRPAGEALWPLVAQAMQGQAYGDWITMMHESLVRASVVRYLADHEGDTAASEEVKRQQQRAFSWMGELSELLAEYESDRAAWPTLADFMPRVVAFFEDYTPRFAEEQRERAARAPKVLRMVPENGARAVDPAIPALVITFDRPMKDKSWAFVGSSADVPGGGTPSFDSTRTVLTFPVQLEAGKTYTYSLNSPRYMSFKSAEGEPLRPVQVSFTTGSGR